ncbi:MAG TPA: helix-turn-helix domain-containing protein [Chloroflexota bacterium]|nr:helix-turn-helix domain-containing protein [Chloroflexota bacterium]
MGQEGPAIVKPYRVALTPEQRAELQRRARERVVAPALRDRLEMVRLSDLGWRVPKVAAYLGKHEQTVRAYVKAFLAEGFAALPDRPRPGRPPALTEAHLQAVERLLDEAAARGERTWSAPQLARWLAEVHGVRVGPQHLGVRLRARRFRWKRTKRTVAHKADPDRQAQAQTDLAVSTF